MLILLIALLFMCYFYIRYTENKKKNAATDTKVCDAIGELVALMIFADEKRELQEYEVATSSINYRFNIAVSDRVKTSVLSYYRKQMVVGLNEEDLDKTNQLVNKITNPLQNLCDADRMAVMEVLCCVARVSSFKKKEWDLFQMVGTALKIDARDMERYHYFFEPHNLSQNIGTNDGDYAVLGLTSDATQQQVSQAYETLIKKYSPDLVIDESLKPVFEDKTKEIETAYKKLKEA